MDWYGLFTSQIPSCSVPVVLCVGRQVLDTDLVGNLCDTDVDDAWNTSALHAAIISALALCRCEKVIYSKKYGVDQICFTHHATSVVYSSKNGWDGTQEMGWDGISGATFLLLVFAHRAVGNRSIS